MSIRSCFNQFQEDYVDLDNNETEQARASCNYLQALLQGLADSYPGFPQLTGNFLGFGSFARKTKSQPLDDIDILVILDGSGTVEEHRSHDLCWLRIQDRNVPLERFSTRGYVSSTKVLNEMCDGLDTKSVYQKCDTKQTMQAITLRWCPYRWSFDIVPAVEIFDKHGNSQHYLIPDGHGLWIRTDPRRDSAFVTSVNQRHSGSLLGVMRLLKYWNNTPHKPKLSSYYFETLVLRVFENAPEITDHPNALIYFFSNCSSYLWSACPDPKSLGPNLDANVSRDTKQRVDLAMMIASMQVKNAIYSESQGNYRDAIYWWQSIFGEEFPDYDY